VRNPSLMMDIAWTAERLPSRQAVVAWLRSALDAVRIRGGYGCAVEYEAERDLRDAVGSTLYSGTSDSQRNLIALSLGR